MRGILIFPGATDAMPLAISKSLVEAPLVVRVQASPLLEARRSSYAVVATDSPILPPGVGLASPAIDSPAIKGTVHLYKPDQMEPFIDYVNATAGGIPPNAGIVFSPHVGQYPRIALGSNIALFVGPEVKDALHTAVTDEDLIDLSAVKPIELTDAEWSKIAALHAEDAQLDQGSQALMQEKSPDAAAAGRRAMSKMIVESPLIRTMRNFQRSIAEDTVRNEYLLHVQIHRWLADPSQSALVNDVSALNKRVYAELFLTPDSDPWLGLVPADTYTALDDDGVCPNPAAQPK